jgi:hypothetical protein
VRTALQPGLTNLRAMLVDLSKNVLGSHAPFAPEPNTSSDRVQGKRAVAQLPIPARWIEDRECNASCYMQPSYPA